MPSLDTCTYKEFVATVMNNKASYATVVAVEEKELTVNFAWEIIELLCHKNFVSRKFQIDILQAPPLLPETINVIRFWYGCFHFWVKTKFHVEQI